MAFNSLLSEQIAVVDVIKPDATAAGTIDTGWISIAAYGALMIVLAAGDLGTNATVDAKLRQAKDASGTGAKDISGKVIAQLTQAGTNKSNKQAIINVRAEELDRNNGFGFVSARVVVATATSDIGGVILGTNARFGPPAQGANVDQIV